MSEGIQSVPQSKWYDHALLATKLAGDSLISWASVESSRKDSSVPSQPPPKSLSSLIIAASPSLTTESLALFQAVPRRPSSWGLRAGTRSHHHSGNHEIFLYTPFCRARIFFSLSPTMDLRLSLRRPILYLALPGARLSKLAAVAVLAVIVTSPRISSKATSFTTLQRAG